MKKLNSLFGRVGALMLALVIAVQLCGCSAASNKNDDGNQEGSMSVKDYSLTAEEFPIYFGSMDNKDAIKLYFLDEGKEMPYLDAENVQYLLEKFYRDVNGDEEYTLAVKKEGSVVTFTRENQHTMVIDADKDIIHFDNYDAFIKPSWSDTVIDVLEHYGTINCLRSDEEMSYSRNGSEVDFNLAEYGVDIVEADGECCIPMQTLSDIALSLPCYVNLVYNRQAVFAIEYSLADASGFVEKIYDAPTGMRSRELADFTYNEFCMVLDYCYGLRKQHGIGKFDDYFVENGLKDRLLNEDPKESTRAFTDLMGLYLGDLHSDYINPSYLLGCDYKTGSPMGQSSYNYTIAAGLISGAQSERYPDGIPGYEEIGNTAYITFDTFSPLEKGRDYYKDPPTADTTDTVGLCLYAFSRITRKDSPVENVVLDLSCNSGGDTTTVSFVLAMFLGEASICVEDTLTGAYANACFRADANLDGEFDDRVDSLEGYNLYCLTSPHSFSCANLAASVLKNSRRVTIVGQQSAGGCCVVMPLSLADGTLAQISSLRSMSYMTNGSLHDIDEGVAPDLYIAKPASFFDRGALTEYINGNP